MFLMDDPSNVVWPFLGITALTLLVVIGVFASIFISRSRSEIEPAAEQPSLERSRPEDSQHEAARLRQGDLSLDVSESSSEQDRRWAKVRSAFRDAQVRMAQYETDPALAIDFPAFNDVSVPEVKTMIAALRTASNLMDVSYPDQRVGGSPELLREIETSVVDFCTAIDAAERAARRLKWSHLAEPDRQDLSQIRGLLLHAENPGNTDAARLNFYAQLQRVVRRLNDRHSHPIIPAPATAELEGQARLSLQ